MTPLTPPTQAVLQRRGHTLWVLTLLAAAMAALAFPPVDLGALAWLALVPLLLVLSQVGPGQGALHGFVFGLVFMGAICWFVQPLGLLPWAALTVGMALYYAVFGLLGALICRHAPPPVRVTALAAAWTLLEMARGSAGPLAFTFGDLGYSQHTQLPVVQFASLAGHYGVSFLVAFLAAAMTTVLLAMLPLYWRRPGHYRLFNRLAGRMALVGYGVVFLVFAWGGMILRTGQAAEQLRARGGQVLRVAAVQGNVPIHQQVTAAEVTLAAETYDRLSRLSSPADLLVWPETAVPTALALDPDVSLRVQSVVQREKTPLLTGAVEQSGPEIYNSAFLVKPGEAPRSVYRKEDLVLFGEYVPMRDRWKFLKNYHVRSQDFLPGTARQMFTLKQWNIAPLICYEGIFNRPTREATALGADVIAIITSDVWAVRTAEPELHSLTAVFRAVEARRYVVRAATDGLTAIYDPYGQVLAAVEYRRPGVAQAGIPVVERRLSTYDQLGDWPLLILCSFFLLLGLLVKAPGNGPGSDSASA